MFILFNSCDVLCFRSGPETDFKLVYCSVIFADIGASPKCVLVPPTDSLRKRLNVNGSDLRRSLVPGGSWMIGNYSGKHKVS